MASLIIYLLVIVLLGRSNYINIKGFVAQKIVNFFIGLSLFMYFFTDLRNALFSFKNIGFKSLSAFYSTEFSTITNEVLAYGIGGVYIVVCLFMSGLAFEIGAIKFRSRKLFVKSFPAVAMVVSIYFFFYIKESEKQDDMSLIIGIAMDIILIATPILFLYSSRWMRSLFSEDNKRRINS